jgi:hypothetical protein
MDNDGRGDTTDPHDPAEDMLHRLAHRADITEMRDP